ncbi:unnamed protein product, partial [Cylicostephanus goldi]
MTCTKKIRYPVLGNLLVTFRHIVYCRYFDERKVELGPPVRSVVFPEHVVHCCRHERAAYMSITYRRFADVTVQVPVLVRKADRYILSFCLSPMFGNETKWLLLAEMIEHYKLQEVEHFYLYIQKIDDYSRKVD